MAWQKARLIRAETPAYCHLVGATFWVKAQPPYMHSGVAMSDYTPRLPCPSFTTNLVGHTGRVKVSTHVVELLPEFCDSAPRVMWHDFIQGAQS